MVTSRSKLKRCNHKGGSVSCKNFTKEKECNQGKGRGLFGYHDCQWIDNECHRKKDDNKLLEKYRQKKKKYPAIFKKICSESSPPPPPPPPMPGMQAAPPQPLPRKNNQVTRNARPVTTSTGTNNQKKGTITQSTGSPTSVVNELKRKPKERMNNVIKEGLLKVRRGHEPCEESFDDEESCKKSGYCSWHKGKCIDKQGGAPRMQETMVPPPPPMPRMQAGPPQPQRLPRTNRLQEWINTQPKGSPFMNELKKKLELRRKLGKKQNGNSSEKNSNGYQGGARKTRSRKNSKRSKTVRKTRSRKNSKRSKTVRKTKSRKNSKRSKSTKKSRK